MNTVKRLELQVFKDFDVETLHKTLLDPLSKELEGNGKAISIMPVYSFNPNKKSSLRTIDLGNKLAQLQFIRITLSVSDIKLATEDVKRFLQSRELLFVSRLKFDEDNYDLLKLL